MVFLAFYDKKFCSKKVNQSETTELQVKWAQTGFTWHQNNKNTSPERKLTICESFNTYIWHLFCRAGCNCRNPFTSTFLGACARMHWAKRHKTPLKIERAKVFFYYWEFNYVFKYLIIILVHFTLPPLWTKQGLPPLT